MVARGPDSLNLVRAICAILLGLCWWGMAGYSGPALCGANQEGAVSVRLVIGTLPYAAKESELREQLSSVGEPPQIVLPVDRETGRPRGFAFVDYADRAVAEAAISPLDQQPLQAQPH